MTANHVNRNMFAAAFSAGLAAVFLIVTGVIGWYPPPNLNLAESSWRRGDWTGEILWGQVTLGVAFLGLAVFLVTRINRRLSNTR